MKTLVGVVFFSEDIEQALFRSKTRAGNNQQRPTITYFDVEHAFSIQVILKNPSRKTARKKTVCEQSGADQWKTEWKTAGQ